MVRHGGSSRRRKDRAAVYTRDGRTRGGAEYGGSSCCDIVLASPGNLVRCLRYRRRFRVAVSTVAAVWGCAVRIHCAGAPTTRAAAPRPGDILGRPEAGREGKDVMHARETYVAELTSVFSTKFCSAALDLKMLSAVRGRAGFLSSRSSFARSALLSSVLMCRTSCGFWKCCCHCCLSIPPTWGVSGSGEVFRRIRGPALARCRESSYTAPILIFPS